MNNQIIFYTGNSVEGKRIEGLKIPSTQEAAGDQNRLRTREVILEYSKNIAELGNFYIVEIALDKSQE